MASPEMQSKVNQLTSKIEGDLTSMVDEIERLKLRPMARQMHACIVACYDKWVRNIYICVYLTFLFVKWFLKNNWCPWPWIQSTKQSRQKWSQRTNWSMLPTMHNPLSKSPTSHATRNCQFSKPSQPCHDAVQWWCSGDGNAGYAARCEEDAKGGE